MIYRGWGVLALLIPICTILFGTYFFGTNGNTSLEIFLYSLLAASPLVFVTDFFLNRKNRHDLWLIPLQYWGIIWAVIAITVLVYRRLVS